MSESDRKYLRRLFHIQIKARLKCQDSGADQYQENQVINMESLLFLEEFGHTRRFGEPIFIGRMREFYKDILRAEAV